MGELADLLDRDHAELDRLAVLLTANDPDTPEWWITFEGLSLALSAHAAAQQTAFRVVSSGPLTRLVDFVHAAHRTQERLLWALAEERTPELRINYALELRASLISHDEQERLILIPGLRDALPPACYAHLAQSYAGLRIRALGMVPALRRPEPESALAAR
jgi:hypothetical protein